MNGTKMVSAVRRIFPVALGVALIWGVAGCHKTATAAADQTGVDPAAANMVQVSGAGPAQQQPAQVLGQRAQNDSQQQAEDYSQQQAAPIERQAPDSGYQPANSGGTLNSDGTMTEAQAEDVYANDLTDDQASEPPPPLPEYQQPPAPEPDYLWTPGYWAWAPGGYYWVPGVWAGAPFVGALWTPGYWGFVGGFYRFHRGYWGPHIGFYGGINYGYGYGGTGYYGGYWNSGHFFYNTAVTRVNVNVIRNVYVHNEVVVNRNVTRVSYNGGRGGLQARPLPAEVAVLHGQRIPPMASQVQVQREAQQNKQQFFNENKGRPAMAVAARPVVADRTLPAPLPRPAAPVAQPGFRGPGQVPNQPGRVQPVPAAPVRNEAGSPAARPAQGPEWRTVQPGQGGQPMQGHPVTPATTPQPNAPNRLPPDIRRDTNPGPLVRPAQPAQQVQPSAPSRPAPPTPQARPVQPAQPVQPTTPNRPPPENMRRDLNPALQTRPVPEVRAPEPQNAPRPTPPPAAAAPAPRPQPQARPAPPPKPAPHEEEKSK